MKKLICYCVAVLGLFLLCASPTFAGALDDLSGKWSLTHTNESGQAYTQLLEIKMGKFTFRITGADKKTVLFAQGDVKVESFNSLSAITFSHIEGGSSADDLNPVEDDRHCIYALNDNTLTIALNFDKIRDKGPTLEVYTKKPR